MDVGDASKSLCWMLFSTPIWLTFGQKKSRWKQRTPQRRCLILTQISVYLEAGLSNKRSWMKPRSSSSHGRYHLQFGKERWSQLKPSCTSIISWMEITPATYVFPFAYVCNTPNLLVIALPASRICSQNPGAVTIALHKAGATSSQEETSSSPQHDVQERWSIGRGTYRFHLPLLIAG